MLFENILATLTVNALKLSVVKDGGRIAIQNAHASFRVVEASILAGRTDEGSIAIVRLVSVCTTSTPRNIGVSRGINLNSWAIIRIIERDSDITARAALLLLAHTRALLHVAA